MKGGSKITYRLSPNEEARLIKEERDKRRKLRLLQVREQAKSNAAKIRNAVKEEKSKQLQILADEIREQWEKEMQEKHRKLEESYMHNLTRIGEGHRNASQFDPKTEMRAILMQEDKRRAKERHNVALERQRQEQELKEAEDNKHIFARLAALEVEKIRAADIANLPPPPPNPVDACLGGKVKPVQFTDLDAFSSTHFHIPSDCAVDRATDHEQIDAKALAEEEELKVRDLDAEKRRLEIERKTKARLRHKAAKDKEMLKQDYDHMLHDLSNLQREDRSRRQNIVHKVPKQIFQPPHRRLEEKEDNQKDMERVFEDMYMAATDYIGDLSLALDPHPAPETPTATESLELSTMEEDEGQPHTPTRLPPEGVLQDVTNRALPSLKDHLKDKDQAKDTTLKKLLDRIKAQREEWISKSSVDEEHTEEETAESSSAVSTQGKTLTQYTITSGEPSNSEAETLSTGEVSQTTTTQSSQRTAESSQPPAPLNGGGSLEEGSITSSSTAVDKRSSTDIAERANGMLHSLQADKARQDNTMLHSLQARQDNAMLHPLQQADKARQYQQQEEDLTAFLAAEREKQELMKIEQEHIIEETLRHQRELEQQKKEVELRLKHLQIQEGLERDPGLPWLQGGLEGPRLPSGVPPGLPSAQYSAGSGHYTLPMSRRHEEETQGREPGLPGYHQSQFAQSVPVNGTYQPLQPDVSPFSLSLPVSQHSESHQHSLGWSAQGTTQPTSQLSHPQVRAGQTVHSSAQNNSYMDHYGRPGQLQHTADLSHGEQDESGQRSGPQSLDSTPPFEKAHKQMQNIKSYQDKLMSKHTERQEKLRLDRQQLEERAKTLLDDSLHQAGLTPIYQGRPVLQDDRFTDLGQFHDVEFSASTERTHSRQDPSDSRRTSANNKSLEASHVELPPYLLSRRSGAPVNDWGQRQSERDPRREGITRQEEDSLEQDRQHNIQMERLQSQLSEQYEQSQKIEDVLRQSQLNALMENHALQAVERDLQGQEHSVDNDDIYQDRRFYEVDSGGLHSEHQHPASEGSEHRRVELSIIVEQETPTSHVKPRDYHTKSQNLSGASHSMSPRSSGHSQHPMGQDDSHPPISHQLAQLQKDINQLHAHSNSFLQLDADDTLTESESQSLEPSSDGMAFESTPSQSKSSAQQVIDELISPLRNGHRNRVHSLGSNKSNSTQGSPESEQSEGRTWHQKLLGIGSPHLHRPDDESADPHGTDSFPEREFFELRPEFASPKLDDRGFDTEHRLSSTPVLKKGTPQFEPIRAEEPSVMSETTELSQYPLFSQNNTRLQSVRSDPAGLTLQSEPSQYPLGSETDLRMHRSDSSSGDSYQGVFSTRAEDKTAQSPSQYPLAEEEPSRRHSPTHRYVSDPYISSDDSSTRIRENTEALTKRMEATLLMHEQLLKESKEIRERRASQRMSSPRGLSLDSQDILREVVESTAGISEEPDLTLVSVADSSVADSSVAEDGFRPLLASPDKPHNSLNSFERHEQSLTSEDSATQFSPLKEINSREWREKAEGPGHSDELNGSGLGQLEVTELSQHSVGSSVQANNIEDGQQQTVSLQEAFARKKADFAESSARRQVEGKEKAKQTSVNGHKPGSRQARMSKTMASWKKSHSNKSSAERRHDPTNIVSVTSPERKKREVDMKKRTDRLYNQLNEVKKQKMENERKLAYAKNREKAKEYHLKQQEKLQKKSK